MTKVSHYFVIFGFALLLTSFSASLVTGTEEPLRETIKVECDNGNASQCAELARLYQLGLYGDVSPLKALQYYKKACETGSQKGCYEAGHMYRRGSGIAKNVKEGFVWYDKACALGSAKSCDYLVRARKTAKIVDQARAMGAQCRRGNAKSCNDMADLLMKHKDIANRKRNAAKAYARACDLKYAESCPKAAEMIRTGQGVIPNAYRADAMLKKGCELGDEDACAAVPEPTPFERFVQLSARCKARDATGCVDAARLLEDKKVNAERPGEIAGFYNTACNLHNRKACLRLAEIHQQGLGVRRSVFAATSAFERACKLGSAISCAKAGEAYLSGKGLKRNEVKAVEFLEKACNSNVQQACTQLVSIYEDPSSRLADKEKASDFLDISCGLGATPACRRIKNVKQNDKTIPRATFLRDFELAKKHLKTFHPNLYVHRTPKQLNRVWKKIEASVPEKLNRADAATYLQMLMASACDEHTSLKWEEEKLPSAFTYALPFELLVKNGELYFDNMRGSRRKWRITRIGRRSDKEIIEFMSAIQSADGCPAGRMQFSRLIAGGSAASGIIANYLGTDTLRQITIGYEGKGDTSNNRLVPFKNKKIASELRYFISNIAALNRAGFELGGTAAGLVGLVSPFNITYNADETVAYISISQFLDEPGFIKDINKKMKELVSKNPKKVIIDLSMNPGGRLTTAQRFASYFLRSGSRLGSKIRTTGTRSTKVKNLEWDNTQIKASIAETKTFLRKWGHKSGNVRSIAVRARTFGNRSTNADISVIVSPITHSAATFVATTLKRNNNAKIFGSVGDLSLKYGCTAAQANFLLPNTKFRIEIPFVCYSRHPQARTKGDITKAEAPPIDDVFGMTDLVSDSLKLALDDATKQVSAN